MWETIIYSIGGTVIGTIAGWFVGRKRQNIDNIDAATTTFNNVINSLEDKINKLLKQQAIDASKIEALTKEVERLNKELENLKADKQENIKLKRKIEKYEKIMQDNNIVY